MKLNRILISSVVILVIAIVFALKILSHPNIHEVIFIYERMDASEWISKSEMSSIDKRLSNVVCLMRGIKHLKSGRYVVSEQESIWSLFSKLRSGNQDPFMVRVGNVETIEELSASLSQQLKCDSTEFQNFFTSDTLVSISKKKHCLTCSIAPDDYELYWTITPAQFFKKMSDIRARFWTDDKIKRAKEIGLTPDEVCILASIVKAESGNTKEIATIAGLYMNRLKIKMPLQSDPTVLFGKKAFRQKRVSFSDLEINSPYNTYKITGLPPGPICLVENQYLDAVLNYEHHPYLYMCAVPGGDMLHAFTDSYNTHLINANAYRKWMDNKKGH